MLGKVKQYLGIEGIKINLELPGLVKLESGLIEGTIVLSTKNTQTARSIKLTLIEKYYRGRRKSKLINEFTLGYLVINEAVTVEADVPKRIPFKLNYTPQVSRMDLIERKFIVGSLAKLAKFVNGVKSEYRIEAEADVKGTALDPTCKQRVYLK